MCMWCVHLAQVWKDEGHTGGYTRNGVRTAHGGQESSLGPPCTPGPHLVQLGLDLNHVSLHLIDSGPAIGMAGAGGRPGSFASPCTTQRGLWGNSAAWRTPTCSLPSHAPQTHQEMETGRGRCPGRRGKDWGPGPPDARAAQHPPLQGGRGPTGCGAPPRVWLLWPQGEKTRQPLRMGVAGIPAEAHPQSSRARAKPHWPLTWSSRPISAGLRVGSDPI